MDVGMRDGLRPAASVVMSAVSVTEGVVPAVNVAVSASSMTKGGGSQVSWVDTRSSRWWCGT